MTLQHTGPLREWEITLIFHRISNDKRFSRGCAVPPFQAFKTVFQMEKMRYSMKAGVNNSGRGLFLKIVFITNTSTAALYIITAFFFYSHSHFIPLTTPTRLHFAFCK